MKRLTIMRGIPGSGKSTYVSKNFNRSRTIVLEYDKLRKAFAGEYFDFSMEKWVNGFVHDTLKAPMDNFHYIVDGTNISTKKCLSFLQYREVFDEINLIWIKVPIEKAIRRDAARDEKCVGKKVIQDMLSRQPADDTDELTKAGYNNITIID